MGGHIYSLGRMGLRPATHLAAAGGIVLAVGGDEVLGLRGSATRVIRLNGGAVLPGFNDAHAHVVYHGLTTFGVALGGCRNIADIQARLRRGAVKLQPSEWLHGMGYRAPELQEGRPPTLAELDEVTGRRPCFVDERGGHSRVSA